MTDTQEAALWTVSRTPRADGENAGSAGRHYREKVLEAVNLGDDMDTVAAVTGGLAGIADGLDFGGYEWIGSIRNKELVLDCLWDGEIGSR